MHRQCAWCLRFMNRFGEPISAPQPKRYELSHGMCLSCGVLWLEQATRDTDARKVETPEKPRTRKVEEETISFSGDEFYK